MFGKIYWLLTQIANELIFKINKISLGNNIKTFGIVKLKKSPQATVSIGDNVIIRSHWKSNPAGGGQQSCIFVVKDHASLTIGNNVGISNSTIFCSKSIVIEDNAMIGVNCIIYDTDFHSIKYSDRMNDNCNIVNKSVTIKEGAWIGGHCIILKGITIGKHSVIGAGSVVTKDVPADEIWAGNPARFIRKIGDNK